MKKYTEISVKVIENGFVVETTYIAKDKIKELDDYGSEEVFCSNEQEAIKVVKANLSRLEK